LIHLQDVELSLLGETGVTGGDEKTAMANGKASHAKKD
jgi:hypothetical protein